MGGLYMTSDDTDDINNEPGLFSIDLTSKFPVEGHLNKGFVHNTSVSTTPYKGTGVFWGDLNQTYLYQTSAADDPNAAGLSTVQGYDIKDNNWQSISVSGGQFNQYDRYWSMHASSFEGGGTTSYIAGGMDYVSGMVIFNASNPTSPTWTNVTDGTIPYFYGCTTQYVRFGDAGVLVSVGGFITESTDAGVAQRREMNSVQVYDIAGAKWFTVYATGDIPPTRSRPCSALSAAPDDSSFQMILHGGWDEEVGLADMYVLTMPAFHWIKMNVTGGNATSGRRMDTFCSTYQDRSMFVIGGKSQLDPSASNISCSDDYAAIRLLDTTTFEWQDQYPLPDTKYQVPQAVIDVIGGNGDGGAKPASAFSQTLGDNAAVFSKTIPHYDPDHPPQDAPKSAASSSATPSPKSSSSTSSGTIAGAAVGGVAGAAVLLGALAWFLLRRRRQNRTSHKQQQQQWAESQALAPNSNGQGYHYLHEMGADGQKVQLDAGEGGMRPFKDTEHLRIYEMGGEPEGRNNLHEAPT
ncbi:hypothetical protein ACLMJK_008951 [Lecanora helva]